MRSRTGSGEVRGAGAVETPVEDLPAHPAAKLLVTSREWLRGSEHVATHVPGGEAEPDGLTSYTQ
jgi:hypothetical protein